MRIFRINPIWITTICKRRAIYKTRNKGTVNGMQGTRGIGGILYSGECRQTFGGMYSNILRNVFQHSGEFSQTFREMLLNISGNVVKDSGEYRQTFRGMQPNIPGNVAKHFFYIYIYIYFNESMDIYKRNRNPESCWIYHNNIVTLGRRLKGDCVNSTRFKILQW